ncbi:DUF3153 domain-containing protein [Natranaerofaba carboxydovora]|uniref:DUF3153 domain-containing protein n=1 Tax=Natranaerofaba carboxydovora TaxID=2742683 RepID=UPI001F145F54|nr:DUF3153 domain-containing protein [Natranaerofaba carboxydovora]UMZ74404.1 hypothetical protein ACONDI_01993 [Natranaerofaba carboxydovora]
MEFNYKKCISILFLLFTFIITSGFIDANYHVQINSDDSNKITLTVKIDKSKIDKDKEEVREYIKNNFYRNLENAQDEGYIYNLTEDDQYYIFLLESINNKSFNDVHFGHLFGVQESGSILSGARSHRTFHHNDINMQYNFGISDNMLDGYLDLQDLEKYSNNIDLKVIVDTPGVLRSHNADKISDGNLVWYIDPYERRNEINFHYTANIRFGVFSVYIVVIVLLVLLFKKIRKVYKNKIVNP